MAIFSLQPVDRLSRLIIDANKDSDSADNKGGFASLGLPGVRIP